MGLKDHTPAEDANVWGLLALCARPYLPAWSRAELRQRASSIPDWDRALALAEYHGLGPLLYRHLRDYCDGLPTQVSRQLRAVYFRHRRSNEIRLKVLSQILEGFQSIGIEPTVLKGPALISLVYEDPGLRPLSDLDVLVPPKDAIRAQRQLGEMGFAAPVPPSSYYFTRHHHLLPALREVDGVMVQVEIHRDVFPMDSGTSFQVTGRAPGAISFDLGQQVGYCLGPDEMLWHLCRHVHWLRLIWIADILGFTERFIDEIDWARVTQRYSFVMNALALIHCLSPLPESVRQRSGVVLVPVPSGIGKEYRGWPRTTALVWDSTRGRLRFVRRSLSPPEWWLRFYYQEGTGRLGLWRAKLRHWAMLVGTMIRRARDLVPRLHRAPRYDFSATGAGRDVLSGSTPLLLLLRRGTHVIKRGADLILGSLGLICAMPVIAVATLGIKLVSFGPAFFSQERVGLHGRLIAVWKLRTMFPDADARLEQYLAADATLREEWASRFKLTNDPRILPFVGTFLRRFSLDELPQLWNVVKGDMSIVGPRPLPEYHLQTFPTAFRDLRQQVRPGMTGLWQVTSRDDGALPEHQLHDEYYVKNWSPWMDLKILVTTMITVVTGRGAD